MTTKEQSVSLTDLQALREYAKMVNTMNTEHLAPLLADDFIYESQVVFKPIKSKIEFLDFMNSKLETIANCRSTVFAEMGTIEAYFKQQPCIILAQDEKNNLIGTALAKVEGNKLKRIDLCIFPPPETTERSGEYPK